MPLVKVQCTNCGGILSADTEKGTALCPFCNTPYILEKPDFGNASGTVRPKNADEIIADGILHIRMKDYRDSFEIFQKYCKSEPGDWRGRYGKAVAAFFCEPGEGLDLRSEEWELFPASLREQKDEMLALAELCGRIRQEEQAFSRAEDRAGDTAELQQRLIRYEHGEADALRYNMDQKYKGILYMSVGYGAAAVFGAGLFIAGYHTAGVILFILALIGALSLLVSRVWGHSFDGKELNMNVSEIRKKREELMESAEDKRRLLDGIDESTGILRAETDGRIAVLQERIAEKLHVSGFTTLEDYYLSFLEITE